MAVKRMIYTDGFEGWKRRSMVRARALDRGVRLTPSRSITLESPEAVSRLLTPGRISLLNTVRRQPYTLTALATKLHRQVAAVSRDVAAMERVGMVVCRMDKNPGHGNVKVVKAAADRIELTTII